MWPVGVSLHEFQSTTVRCNLVTSECSRQRPEQSAVITWTNQITDFILGYIQLEAIRNTFSLDSVEDKISCNLYKMKKLNITLTRQ